MADGYRSASPGLAGWQAGYSAFCVSESTPFKLYFSDTALPGAMAGLHPRTLLTGSVFFTEFKGAMSVQFVLRELLSQRPDVLYWSSDGSRGKADFITVSGDQILPIEVKPGLNVKSKSLHSFVQRFSLKKGIRFSLRPYCEQDWLVNYPLCFAGKLFDFYSEESLSIVEISADIR